MNIISGCSIIEDCIRRYGKDARTRFVFPSRIASRLWLHRGISLTGLAAIPAELFTAWDAFKADCCVAKTEGRNPVSQVIRLLFARHIAAENAAQPFFRTIIPANYAADGAVFAQWIAGILPQLDHWEKRAAQHKAPADDEAADLFILKKAYMDFLDSHRLFEPSWAGAEFSPQALHYILLYPELMEDFEEYRELLTDRSEISVLPAPVFQPEAVPLIRCASIREEIRTAVLAVEQLLADGAAADEIAFSVADIESTVPYLKREFALRSIPAEFRLGFKLSEQQAGRLFPLLERCVEEHFSFESLKRLFLNSHIPWKSPQHIQAVINFGIKNNCLVSWKDGDQYRNIWEEAFKLPTPHHPGQCYEEELAEKEQAKNWLIPFMRDAEALVQAKSFSEIRHRYIMLRDRYLNLNGFSPEDNAVIGRCVTLMQELIQLEPDFADCLPAQPYPFFTAQLGREIYVPQNTGRAVSIFPFRVAAATPFTHHFVLNCNQGKSRVIYTKLPFLRKDKRDALGVIEHDATQDFFAVYAQYGTVQFSFSEQIFSGYAVSNGIFTEIQQGRTGICADSFLQEYAFFAQAQQLPASIYPVQKTGLEQFVLHDALCSFSFLRTPLTNKLPELTQALHTARYEDGVFRVNASDLKLFAECPAKWFLQSVLSINEEDTDADLFNPRYVGLLSHHILEKLYQKIQETDTVFISAHIDEYTKWADELFAQTIHTQTDFQGPLAAPFIQSIKKKTLQGVSFVLSVDAEKLDGYTPLVMEGKLRHRSEDILYHGVIDRVAYQQAEDRAVILDYKSGTAPAASSYTPDAMRDFQIPMYLFLAEKELVKSQIEHAFFLGLGDEKISYIVNDPTVIPHGSARTSKTRDAFEPAIESFLRASENYAHQVGEEDFRKPETVQWDDCKKCPFHRICRTVFIVE
ncbi:MAG: PD-(D/E)XK nuclease family protein [Treponema sp.]|uniref:PD-(D/E)XK nuclease family protein n=1 Tax=Treponema sp. TaxID=166 RepID=UPI003FA1FC6A